MLIRNYTQNGNNNNNIAVAFFLMIYLQCLNYYHYWLLYVLVSCQSHTIDKFYYGLYRIIRRKPSRLLVLYTSIYRKTYCHFIQI